MAGRVEHDHHLLGLGLVFGDVRAQRHSVVDHLAELFAALLHRAHGRQAVHRDVQVHAHLLRALDGWPDGRHERFLSLERLRLFDEGGTDVGGPDGTRTRDPLTASQVLYRAELQAPGGDAA